MRRILEEDDSDGPNVLMPLLLRKSQTIPIIYFGKQQKMVNRNTGWSTCPPPTPPQKGKLHDQVCWREANEIIIYGWRKFAYMMWFVKVFLPCFNPYKKTPWDRSSQSHSREKENESISPERATASVLSPGQPCELHVKQTTCHFFCIKENTIEYRATPRRSQANSTHQAPQTHLSLWRCIFRLVLTSRNKVSASASRDSEGLLSMKWIVHRNAGKRRQFC